MLIEKLKNQLEHYSEKEILLGWRIGSRFQSALFSRKESTIAKASGQCFFSIHLK